MVVLEVSSWSVMEYVDTLVALNNFDFIYLLWS